MKIHQASIEAEMTDYLSSIFHGSKAIGSDTRICGDLGLCDEDLWDLVDTILERHGLKKPTPKEPAEIAINQADITVKTLASWICEYQLREYGDKRLR